ncbi:MULTISPECIES: sulfate adenylyltransferase subunit CysN [Rhizobium/Agrobacterium group]|uniref:Multifunctional fusion protein n=1 Tax=Neorhizobium petrolearium TaxID=515361 RepID=A0ABY8MBP3_9HYPH|nr:MULTISPECIES: sulfate adenylyltransferase subunit CysN [Rhizobium/Agrobacterium group]KGE02460.1 adenylyltransferase [Rhizobium sp. YS-1r]WGI71927.1 sulfate adenylyltransferase subunit CysN [Neorhizobium petrolearium]
MVDNMPSEQLPNLSRILHEQENKSLLRFLTCGSVDDGKSTLIGRLLYDTKLIFDDHLAALRRDSARHGTTSSDDIDFALLLDGLEAEREQGITIDVAYRFFATERRKFIVADTPGHEEYTRNMATGASTADLAVMLVDIRKGILPQTRRHSCIASLLRVPHIVLAVNKIDLVSFDQEKFEDIVAEYRRFASDLGFTSICPIPVSARFGDNVIEKSTNTPWYEGPTLLQHLETVPATSVDASKPFRFPIQLVSRPNSDFRGFSGQVAAGRIGVGDPVVVAKSGRMSKVMKISTYDGFLPQAVEGQAITLLLEDELDLSRGDMLVAPKGRPHVSDQFQANIIWFDKEPMFPGRSYILKTETDSVDATITSLRYQIDVADLGHVASKTLRMNEIGTCNVATQAPIVFDSYGDNRLVGNFILIDRLTNRTVGAGMINFPLRRADNLHWQTLEVTAQARANLLRQRPAIVWFTGFSGSGKSTIANNLEKLLHAKGRHTCLLDGDNVRHGLCRDLGFTDEDRVENIRRVAEVAKLMADAGLIVLVAFISPFRSERQMARDLMGSHDFIEVFIDTPIEECARRDPKGLYAKARAGMLLNFTGIDSSYEAPEKPDMHLQTVGSSPQELAIAIEEFLERQGRDLDET